jgi:putative intracellular protease/amidase
MNRLLAAAVLLPLALLATAPACSTPRDDAHGSSGYVCPMPEHTQVFDHPGQCPLCGMDLVPRKGRRAVAILLFDGVQIIDYTAPYEVFGQAGYLVFTVAATPDPITTGMGMKVTPTYDFAHAPAADVIVLPGGNVQVSNARIIDWIRERSPQSKVVLSVCNGAFWLAKAGLLDGLSATTTSGRIGQLQATSPTTRVVRDRRWVDNGRIVTAAGLSSGIEGALHVVEKLSGADQAREVALHIEYDWRPDSKWARANLADRWVADLQLGDGVSYRALSSLGDADHWRMEGLATTALAPEALADRLGKQLAARPRWTAAAPARVAAGVATRHFSFKDDEGRLWNATLRLAPGATAGEIKTTLEWARTGAPAERRSS